MTRAISAKNGFELSVINLTDGLGFLPAKATRQQIGTILERQDRLADPALRGGIDLDRLIDNAGDR